MAKQPLTPLITLAEFKAESARRGVDWKAALSRAGLSRTTAHRLKAGAVGRATAQRLMSALDEIAPPRVLPTAPSSDRLAHLVMAASDLDDSKLAILIRVAEGLA